MLNDRIEQVVHRSLSELGSFLKVANDLASEKPQVVDVFLHGLFRQTGAGELKKKRREAFDDFLAGHEIAFIAHPA